MPPPEHTFPVSHLPDYLNFQLDKTGHLRSRPRARPQLQSQQTQVPHGDTSKRGSDSRSINLQRDCQLMELVQYSCTQWQEMISLSIENAKKREGDVSGSRNGAGEGSRADGSKETARGPVQAQCWPVVRLFRR